MLTVANSKKEQPAATPLASPEKQTPETERRIAIIGALNALVSAPEQNGSKFPWTYVGPPAPLLALMKKAWTSPGLPGDAESLVAWCRAPGNYKRMRAAGLLVSHPKHPQGGPGRERPDLIKVERAGAEGPDMHQPQMIDGVAR